ncbi:hypothetical protein [Sneathiella limimaris]|uniref:hypothetical protein n=1 Tax=Sneathiella limimaris TaxID=1964213 RepID=UPI00146CE95A|nr:hypothetical protein [Sneathiella limimaris]
MKKIAYGVLPFLLLSSPAIAEDTSYPNISGEISIEIENDWTHDSDDEAAEINDLYPTVDLVTTFAFTPELSANLEATLESIDETSEDREFDDLGAYISVLTVNYDTDAFSVYAGKFGANFGIAWDAAPGLGWGNLADDYEIAEVIGFGGAVNFNLSGEHSLSGSVFFADTSFLSDSLGDSRGPLEKSDGGPANTESLESFALALDGGFDALEGFRYHIGFASLEEGEDGDTNQLGYALGAEYEIQLNDEFTLTPIGEIAFLEDAGGVSGDDIFYGTAGATLGYNNWSFTTSYHYRDTDSGGTSVEDYYADATIGYEFDFGLFVAAGYRFAEEDDVDSRILGVLINYTFEF